MYLGLRTTLVLVLEQSLLLSMSDPAIRARCLASRLVFFSGKRDTRCSAPMIYRDRMSDRRLGTKAPLLVLEEVRILGASIVTGPVA